MIVVDASAVVEILLKHEAGLLLRRRLTEAGETLHAPHLLDVEIAHALRRYERRRELSADRAREAFALLSQMRVSRYPHGPFLARMWELRRNLTAYDAAYIALAEGLDATLVTHDAKLASAPGHNAQIDVI